MVVDGEPVALPDKLVYKSAMLSDVPNLAFVVRLHQLVLDAEAGSRLRVRLQADLLHGQRGYDTCVPVNADPAMETRPLLDFGAGYVQRAVEPLPPPGNRRPWQVKMSYREDSERLRHGVLADGVLRFAAARERPVDRPAAPVA